MVLLSFGNLKRAQWALKAVLKKLAKANLQMSLQMSMQEDRD